MAWYNPVDWVKSGYNAVTGLADESKSATEQRDNLNKQAGEASDFAKQLQTGYGGLSAEGKQASDFANQLQTGFAGLSGEGQGARNLLRDQALGRNSLSAEQLRQGLQQQQAQMQSMAAGASPGSAPMAARTAMLGASRASSAMAGNAAQAGIAERAAAQKAWADAIGQAQQQNLQGALQARQNALSARQQDLQAALQARQNAIQGYTGIAPDKSFIEKWGPAIQSGASIAALSDRRAKTDIDDASGDVDAFLDGIAPWSFRYLDEEKGGAGRHVGIMAQELQESDAGRSLVVDTEAGLMVDLKQAVPLLLATVARLNKRLRELEARG